MKKLDILNQIKDQYIKQGISTKDIDNLIDKFKVNEDTSATGGISVGNTVSALGIANVGSTTAGMGPVVSSNPSSNPGSTIGTDFTSGGGTGFSGVAIKLNDAGLDPEKTFVPFPSFANTDAVPIRTVPVPGDFTRNV